MKTFLVYLSEFFGAFTRKAARTNLRNKAMRSAIVASTAVAGLSGCVVHVGHHGHDDSEGHKSQESLSLSADSISRLYIDSGAGAVEVKGVKGATSIEVSAHIISRHADGSDVVFTLERDGGVAQLIGKRSSGAGFRFGNNNTSVNMTVTMPADLALRIDDGSGAITVSNIDNDVSIDDGSGAITVSNIDNDVSIDDGSGSLSVRNVVGDVDIKDGSGWLEVNHVDGKVNIDDNSGAMNVEYVTGRVNIDDGSGAIEVKDVTNEVLISDGSGAISVARVSHLNILDAGSGGVSVVDVDNNLSAYLERD